jgi:hypothetical protein
MAGAQQAVLLSALSISGKILTYQTTASQTPASATVTFSAQAIGAASADRRVIVAVSFLGSLPIAINSATIGGVSATIIRQASAGVSGTCPTAAIIIANVPTGTTADVVFNLSNPAALAVIGVWQATGLSADAAHDSQSATATSGTTLATTTATTSTGFIIGASMGAGSTVTWSSFTERYDTSGGSGSEAMTNGTGITETVTFSNVSNHALVTASW